MAAMKHLLATAAVLALTSVSATGAERYQPNDVTRDYKVPPAEFDKPFDGRLEEFVVNDLDELEKICRQASVLGCVRHWPVSETGPALCDLYRASDELIRRHGHGLTTELVRRHEIAHCNGWHHPAPGPPKIDPWSLKVSKP
jgi:hypothetical protein